MKAILLVFIVGLLHALQINGLETKSEQILEAKIRRLERRLTDLEAKVDLCSDNNEKLTSKPERAAMEKRIESLESEVLDWKNQVNLLQITVDTLAQQCNATEEKVAALDAKNAFSGTLLNSAQQEVGNVTITVGQLASEHENIKGGGNDTLELTTASNATQQEVPVGRCNVLFPNEPNRFPEVHEKDQSGLTPLHYAARNSIVDEVCQLLEKGADPNLKDRYKQTPLHWAAWFNSNADVTRVLLEKGADPNLKDDGGNTPLHHAVDSNSEIDVTIVLLEIGANPNLKNNRGWTPLHRAVSNSNANKTRVLLEKGADPNSKNDEGNTPLHLAIKSNSEFDAIRVLLEKGADPNSKNKKGGTPLHWAAQFNKNVDVVRVLLEKGADHSLPDEDGNTALHWAATSNSNIHVMILLLEKGADHSLMNNDGDTPLSVASTKNKKSVLIKYGAQT